MTVKIDRRAAELAESAYRLWLASDANAALDRLTEMKRLGAGRITREIEAKFPSYMIQLATLRARTHG